MSVRFLVVVLFFLLTAACIDQPSKVVENYVIGPLGDSSSDWLIYSIGSPGSGQGLVAGVKEVGFDENYIIVRSGIAHYYVVAYSENEKDFFDEDSLFGPMSLEEFVAFKEEKGISDLEFD